MVRFSPFTHIGLRARITLTLALSGLALAFLLSALTFTLTRETLINQREASAINRVLANATTVHGTLSSSNDPNYESLLTSLPTPEGGQPVIDRNGSWAARNPAEFGPEAIPMDLQLLVSSGQPARMYTQTGGKPYLIVGVPVQSANASYYEGVPLEETEAVVASLARWLLGASVVFTAIGALTGVWVSRRAVAPLARIGQAAESIAEGNLDTRLAVSGDPDLDKLTGSFNEMVSTLDARIERDARFASEVSHELRSPLMTLAASVEVLDNSRDELTERGRMALDLIKADIDRFQQLVEDLLEISRFDVGAITLHLEEVPVTEVVLQAVNTSGSRRIPVIYDEDADAVAVAIDKRRFGRVLDNLIDNAAKYAGGATAVRIELARSRPERSSAPDLVRIAVEDAGHGVPTSEREAVFDRFSRGIEGGNRGADTGVGLGLALVDEHVRLHGGRVWVEDRHDGRAGARFVVELPIAASDASDAGEAMAEVTDIHEHTSQEGQLA